MGKMTYLIRLNRTTRHTSEDEFQMTSFRRLRSPETALLLLLALSTAELAAQVGGPEMESDTVPSPEVIRREGIATIRVFLSSEGGMFGEVSDELIEVDSFDLQGRRVRRESSLIDRSITTWTWTEEGEIAEVVKRKRGGRVEDTIVIRTMYEYGPTGRGSSPRRLLHEVRIAHVDGRDDTAAYRYHHDDEGRLFWKENVSEMGEGFDGMYSWEDSLLTAERTVASGTRAIREFARTSWSHDSLGRRIGMVRHLGKQQMARSTFEYDDNNRTMVERRYNGDDKLFLELTTTRDEAGRTVQQTSRDGTGSIISTAIWTYNEAGLPTTITTTGQPGNTHTRFDYTYI